jgi:hypothetical protein
MKHRRAWADAVGAAAIGLTLVVITSGPTAGSSVSTILNGDRSQAACIRLSKPDSSRKMPQPKALTGRLVGRADGPLTMAPVKWTKATEVVVPQTLWHQFPKTRGGNYFVFLAYVSYPFPAFVQPDGQTKPALDHLLSWLVLSLDTAGFNSASGPGPGTKAVTSKCIFGQPRSGSLEIWNAATGTGVESTGFTLVSPPFLDQALQPLPRSTSPSKPPL